jgi:hypothetical protein
MKATKTLFLFILVAGMAAYILLIERYQMSQAERSDLMSQAFRIQTDQVNRMKIRTASYEVDLFQTNGVWQLSKPVGARASESVVRQTLSRLRNLDRGELITPEDMRKRSQTLGDFGLLLPKLALTIETPLQKNEYRIGDPTPLGQSLYVKDEASQNVMLVSVDLLDILPPSADLFHDPVVFPFNSELIQAVSLIQTNQTVRLTTSKGAWQLTEPKAHAADAAKVNALLEKLMRARAEGFEHEPEQGRDYGLSENRDRIRIQTRGSAVAHELAFGEDVVGEPGLCYAQIVGRAGLIKVSKGLKLLARTQANALRNTQLLPADENFQVDEIQISSGDLEIQLVRKENDWRMLKPIERDAEDVRVREFIEIWKSGIIVGFDLTAKQEVEVSRTVHFTQRFPNNTVSFALIKLDSAPGRSVLKTKDDEYIRVTPDLLNYTAIDPLFYVSKEIFRFDVGNIVRLSIRREEDPLEFTSTTNSGELVLRNADLDVIPSDVNQFSTTVARLSAMEIATLVATDLNVYGLDEPAARISIGLGGDVPSNKTLLLSAPLDDGSTYGMVLGDSVVYVISAADSQKLMLPLGKKRLIETETEDVQPEIDSP